MEMVSSFISTSVKNEFVALSECDGCDSAVFGGFWWVEGGDLYLESHVTYEEEGARDRNQDAYFMIDF